MKESLISIFRSTNRHIKSLKNSEFRDLVSATNDPNLVPSDKAALSFIDDIPRKSSLIALGANYISDVNPNSLYPRIVKVVLSDVDFSIPEVSAAPEIDVNFEYSDTSPNRYGAFARISKAINIHNPGISRVLNDKVTAKLINQVEKEFFTDLLANVSVSTTTGVLSHDVILNMELAVGIDSDFVDSLGYIFNPADLKKIKLLASAGGELLYKNGMLNGFRAVMSSSIPAGTLLFGKFNEAYLLQYDKIEVMVDPFSNGILGENKMVINAYFDYFVTSGTDFAKLAI